MNLNGRWQGTYVLGKGYPQKMMGRSAPFEFEITEQDGIFTGTCIDEVVQAIPGNTATIEGVFKDGEVSFLKKYKYQAVVDDHGKLTPSEDVDGRELHYTGRLFKKFFSKGTYFRGEWTLTSRYENPHTGEAFFYTLEGTWVMEKL